MMTKKRPSLLLACVMFGLGCATVEGGPEFSPPDLARPTRFGFVRLGSSSVTSGPDTYEQTMATALFYDSSVANPVCVRREYGPCVTYRCGVLKGVPSAGDIKIKGSPEDVVLAPNTDGAYPEYRNTAQLLFQRGQALTIEATGKDLPAFSTPVTFPSYAFALKSPSPARIDLTWLLKRTQDLMLTWTPLVDESSVRIELSQDVGSNQSVFAECSFPGNLGTATVPANVLGEFQTTVGISHVLGVLVGPGTETKLSIPDWDLSVYTIGVGRTGIAILTE